ncbi:MAG: T9SS type A sorting domain-containing protein [Ferruginibacter sp.]
MRTFIPVFLCCFFSCQCFSQSSANTDSGKTTPAIPPKAKGNIVEAVQPELNLYPNPAKNKVTLQVKNFSPGMVVVKVLDTKGKLVREDNRLLTNGTEDIVMFLMLKEGIYFILVSANGNVARKKLVVI